MPQAPSMGTGGAVMGILEGRARLRRGMGKQVQDASLGGLVGAAVAADGTSVGCHVSAPNT